MANQRHISPLLFLTPRLPAFLISWRLNRRAQELLQLDRALSRLGPQQLSDSELRQVRIKLYKVKHNLKESGIAGRGENSVEPQRKFGLELLC